MSIREEIRELKTMIFDLAEAMQLGFARTDERFDQVKVDMDTQFVEVRNDIRALYQLHSDVEIRAENQEDTVLNHEERIVTLEKWRKDRGGFPGMAPA
jgi:hypothetical protein